MSTKNRLTVLALVLATTLGGAAIAVAHETDKKPAAQSHSMAGMNHDMAGMANMSEGSKQLHEVMMKGMKMHMQGPMPMTGNVDTDFATMMTMHHQQAIQMSDVLLKYGKNAELRALAQKMKAAQAEEIRIMAKYKAPAKK
ncbi:DUF305 domain-containing protein [Cognatilysobacter terrigena]|uniref:DUF305 domain-containing protein n=1 Tax=Cognatilysobacter terrigena TaxID=2488749 RepID=UPI0014152FE9|nr:DUF305 domain-containing protein [Lysobacter terrigena]